MPLLHRHPNAKAAAAAAAERVLVCVTEALGRRGVATVALAGGRTPELLYGALCGLAGRSDAARDALRRVDWFFSDERRVPPDDERSNYGAAARTLFEPLKIESARVRRLLGEAQDAEAEAARYAADLTAATGDRGCDVVLLGLGADGHVASLYPGAASLDEKERLVVPAEAKLRPFVPRLTFTFAAIERARDVIFLATGAEKAAVLRRVLIEKDPSLPATRVAPKSRRVAWFVDEAAAGAV